MKFIFADALDMVDPNYDFIADESPRSRKPYWDDRYPHELLGYAPYDGVLVSRGIVGDHRFKGKYTTSQSMRFNRVGAREFLRLNTGPLKSLPIFGDCGAFSYASFATPPYTPEEMIEFYVHGQFTHCCSVDHIIFEFDRHARGMEGGSQAARERFDITLENADQFLKSARAHRVPFTPIGVVQGWSPGSKAEAAKRLVAMGYDYIALGGMVPLNAQSIHACLEAVAAAIPAHVRVHLLGFAKAEQIHEFVKYKIASFDTTSPLLRAFKDARSNYYVNREDGGLDYYTAIRIPQALENTKLKNATRAGFVKQDLLAELEATALGALRAYDVGRGTVEQTAQAVLSYSKWFSWDPKKSELENERTVWKYREKLERTLRARPWRSCGCPICEKLSIEVVLFRGNNRNRRRGFHNLVVFHQHVKRSLKQPSRVLAYQ
jgi:hypothetical protein